jgi:hypothetical protein
MSRRLEMKGREISRRGDIHQIERGNYEYSYSDMQKTWTGLQNERQAGTTDQLECVTPGLQEDCSRRARMRERDMLSSWIIGFSYIQAEVSLSREQKYATSAFFHITHFSLYRPPSM